MKPATTHITARQARDFALMRSGISQPFDDPLAAVHAMIAVQAQYAASIPFAIHARCPSAPRAWTDRALVHERSLVKTWCLRGTLHALAADDLALMVGSFGERYHLAIERVMLRMCGMDTAAWYRVEQDTLHALAAGPLDRTALHAAVPRLRDVPWSGWGEDVKGLAYQGDLLMVGSKGARPVFARRDMWLPDLRFRPRTRIKSLEELLVRYLRAFAPATLTDFAHWTGLPMATARETVVRATKLVAPVAVEGRSSPLLVLTEDTDVLRKPLPDIPTVALLPKFDALLLGWKDPSRVLDGGDRAAVFRPAGQIEAIVLLRGHAAATWRVKQTPGSMGVTVTPVQRMGVVARRQVEAEFECLGTWSGARNTTVTWQD
ncbi:MAG: winged helix DNA-binding domain-containing protein [Candidatus Cryosericum sp.]